MNYSPIESKTALNRVKRNMPYKWDLNIYRGCNNRCAYCYALYSHKYLKSKDFYGDIYVKSNIVELLEKQMKKSSWMREVIAIGTVTDSYQAIEKELKMMPEILKIFIKYKNPAIISTKSDLILRDIEYIKQLSEITYLNVASSIISFDKDISHILEPNASYPQKRIEMLNKIKKETNASVGLHIMPIIPFITDNYDDLNQVFKNAKKFNVDYILPNILNLYGHTKVFFFKFLKNNFNDKYDEIKAIFNNSKLKKEYTQNIYKIIFDLSKKYEIDLSYKNIMDKKLKEFNLIDNYKQTTLFD
ncbi:MAG: radical SAM protein [Methanobrevibacter sp.]|jgi:DNA repair photolyase|nr:radical SAM protein [Candidatus Methanoflexus mossambicus]